MADLLTANLRHGEAAKWWGIDGCKAGWFCIGLGDGDAWQARVVVDSADLLPLTGEFDPALIDIPIGLIDTGRRGRRCDREARRKLGWPRSSSVFSAPSRLALDAADYRVACDINQKATGLKISRQAWAIAPKIRAIDNLLRSQPGTTRQLRECHPEICFWALNGGRPMVHNKKKPRGRLERIKVLNSFLPQAERIVDEAAGTWARKLLAVDDIVDALVAAVTARLANGVLQTLPETPDVDNCGLPMEIVYFPGR